MKHEVGTSRSLSLARRNVCDFLHASQQIPTVSIERRMDLRQVVEARQRADVRPSWCSMFTKAFALVAAPRPELRRAFVSFPYARLYDHPVNIASVVIESRFDGEDALVFVPIPSPETWPLLTLDQHLAACKLRPRETVKGFRHALHVAHLPWPLRRLLWWSLLNVSGYHRSRKFGTFGVTSVAGVGADSLRPLSPWPSLLHYGVIDKQGLATVRLTYDHRVMDGTVPSRALQELERTLQTTICQELRMPPLPAAA